MVNSFYDINVFTEYTETISLVYYSIKALFVVFTNELVTNSNFSFVSSLHIDSLFSFKSKIILGCLKISTIKKAFSSIFSYIFYSEKANKITMSNNGLNCRGQSAAFGGLYGHTVDSGRQSAALGGLYSQNGRGLSKTNDSL